MSPHRCLSPADHLLSPPSPSLTTGDGYEEPISLRASILSSRPSSQPRPPREGGGEEVAGQPDETRTSDDEGAEEDAEEGEGEGETEEEPSYVDIDHRHSDYINVDVLNIDQDSDSDPEGEEGEGAGPRRPIRGSGYAPSVKLHSHPLLRKSQSQSESADSAPSSMVELMKAAGRKPKNRAPPPPPGSQRDEGKKLQKPNRHSGGVGGGGAGGVAGAGHHRSRSDVVATSDGSLSSHRSQPADSIGQRLPIPELQQPHPPAPSSAHQKSPLSQRRAPRQPSPAPSSTPSSSSASSATQEQRSLGHAPRGGPSGSSPKFPQKGSTPAAKATPPYTAKPSPQAHTPARGGAVGGAADGGGRTGAKSRNPPPPPPSAPAPHAPKKDQMPSRHVNAWGEEKGAARTAPPIHERSQDADQRSSSRDQQNQSPSSGNTTPTFKPKRHAPPPPQSGGASSRRTPNSSPEVLHRGRGGGGGRRGVRGEGSPPPPLYAEVMKEKQRARQNLGGRRGEGQNGRGVAPPKPTRLSRSMSLSDLTESQVHACACRHPHTYIHACAGSQ